jgi:hypothetical protein
MRRRNASVSGRKNRTPRGEIKSHMARSLAPLPSAHSPRGRGVGNDLSLSVDKLTDAIIEVYWIDLRLLIALEDAAHAVVKSLCRCQDEYVRALTEGER